MEHHVAWPRDSGQAPVFIDKVGSVDEILDATFLSTKLKESGLQILGIMIDADDKPLNRWERLCALCGREGVQLPNDLPKEGLVVDCKDGLRFGFWLMPDCSSKGMLETFLRYLVPEQSEPLWAHAVSAFDEARSIGARCRGSHADKGRVHTWLAWQDPPGERLGIALTKKIFDPHSAMANAFITWFKDLYQL